MSTIKVTNIQDTSGNNQSTSEQIAQGRAKVWVNFDGAGTITIRDDFNATSLTDNGTGNYTVNFTNAMSNNNYACSTTGGNETGNGQGSWVATRDLDDNLTTSVRIVTYNNSGSFQDTTQVYLIVFGD